MVIGPAEPEAVDVPEDLAAALARDSAAQTWFSGLSVFYRKQFCEWFAGAKTAQTRASRVEKAVVQLREGLKQPSAAAGERRARASRG